MTWLHASESTANVALCHSTASPQSKPALNKATLTSLDSKMQHVCDEATVVPAVLCALAACILAACDGR